MSTGRSEDRDEEQESFIQQFLEDGETLLFYSNDVELEQVPSRLGSVIDTSQAERLFKTGKDMPFVVTDKRILALWKRGVGGIGFEAIFDYEYAKKRLQTIKEDQERRSAGFDKEKWNELGYFGKLKYQREQSKQHKGESTNPKWGQYSNVLLPLLVQAEKKKKMIGGEYILLTTQMVVTIPHVEKGIDYARTTNAIFGILRVVSKFKVLYELKVRKSLKMSTIGLRLASTATMGLPGLILSVLATHKGRTNEYYDPILDIVQAKANDISQMIRDLESSVQ